MRAAFDIKQIPQSDWDNLTGEVPKVIDWLADRIRFEDNVNRFSGNTIPTTMGLDFCFLRGFLNAKMSRDFPRIEREFFKHCYHRFNDFEEGIWCGGERFFTSSPKLAMQLSVLTMMYNGAKSHDAYCVELIRYLYKTYHKREYKQLKRFRTITGPEIVTLLGCEEGDDEPAYFTIGRLVGICPILGIEVDEECSVFYITSEKIRREYLTVAGVEDGDLEESILDECAKQVDDWIATYEKGRKPERQQKIYRNIDKFIGTCLCNKGYPKTYVYDCLDSRRGNRLQLMATLQILKLTYPNREFTYEEAQWYTQICCLLTSRQEAAV